MSKAGCCENWSPMTNWCHSEKFWFPQWVEIGMFSQAHTHKINEAKQKMNQIRFDRAKFTRTLSPVPKKQVLGLNKQNLAECRSPAFSLLVIVLPNSMTVWFVHYKQWKQQKTEAKLAKEPQTLFASHKVNALSSSVSLLVFLLLPLAVTNDFNHTLLSFCFWMCPCCRAARELYIQASRSTIINVWAMQETKEKANRPYALIFLAQNICRKKQLINLSDASTFTEQSSDRQSLRNQMCRLVTKPSI